MRRVVTAREQAEMLSPWRTATPWYSKPGDPTYQVPVPDLVRHRQFNPAITTPEQMFDSTWTRSWDKNEAPYRNFREDNFSSGGSSEGSQEEDLVEGFENGAKFPPVEISTNGYGATLTDGNHRTEVADMLSHPELESYIHYQPHADDDEYENEVDPETPLGKHIQNLVQNHPYKPIDGGIDGNNVFRRHPETGQWQRGKMDHTSPPQYVDDEDYAQQMTEHVPGYKHDGLGTYFDVDWGNGPEITHERHLHARRQVATQRPHPGLQLHYHPDQDSVDAAYGPGSEIQAPAVTAHHPESEYQPTGFLQWDTADVADRPNAISWIDVDPDFRRQGIGDAMWNHARQFNPDLVHSPQRSVDGDEWAQAVGGEIPPLMDEYEDDGEDW